MSDTDAYEHGYSDGEKANQQSWEYALEDLIPDEILIEPEDVAEYIRKLKEGRPVG